LIVVGSFGIRIPLVVGWVFAVAVVRGWSVHLRSWSPTLKLANL